jgi:hypothetical protein
LLTDAGIKITIASKYNIKSAYSVGGFYFHVVSVAAVAVAVAASASYTVPETAGLA